MTHAPRILPRLRVAALTVVMTATLFTVNAAPVSRPLSDADNHRASAPLPFGLGPQPADANYCASGPAFTGWLTQQLVNSGTPSTAGYINNSTVYGYISSVGSAWSCTLYRRYSGIAWNTTSTLGMFDYGTIINSTSVSCNWAVGSTDYLKANGTQVCPSTDTSNVLAVQLTAQRVYQNDVNHDTPGDFSFVHSDCDTTPYYGAEATGPVTPFIESRAVSFSTSIGGNRPGSNCDAIDLDGTGTGQTVTYDATAPSATINQATGQADPSNASPVNFTLSFSEPITGLTGSDITIGGTAPGTKAATISGTGPYAVAISGMTGPGTVTAALAAGKVTDLASNANTAATSTDNGVTYDAVAPTATILAPTANQPVGGDVSITGTATDAGSFKDYLIDVGAGLSPSSWTRIGSYASPVANGPLATWSTADLSGVYTLRLTVEDNAGNTPAVDTHVVFVDNTRLGEEGSRTRVPFDLGGGWSLGVGVEHGDASLARELFSLPSYGPQESLSLHYSSADTATGAFGTGWSSNLTQYLSFESGFVVWHRDDGGRVPFGQVAGIWTPLAGSFETLSAGTGGDAGRYIVTLKDQTRLVFEDAGAGRLLRIDNRFGKCLTITWGTPTTTVTDGTGRTTTLTFSGAQVQTVLDGAGRTWTFGYAVNDLTTITEPDPDDLRPWGGANGPLASPVTAIGHPVNGLTVTRHRRTATGGDDTIVWTVGFTAGTTTVRDPLHVAANQVTYATGSATSRQLVTDVSPPTYADTTYTLDALGRTTSILDPLLKTTAMHWNPDSTLDWVTDPNGTKTAYTYTPDGRGNTATETADATGAAVVTKYDYNGSNDVTKTYVAYGSPDEVDSTQTFDTAGTGGTPGHLQIVTQNSSDPDPAKRQVTTYAYTANDQVLAERDPKLVLTTHAYDLYGNETQSVANCTDAVPPTNWWQCTGTGTPDAATNVSTTTTFAAGSMAAKLGLPASTTTVLTGRTTALVYDVLGRTTSETPPEGQTTHEWDELGNEIRTTPPGLAATTRILDLAGNVITEAAPLRTTTTEYDATGAVTKSTVANDSVSRTYDGAGQLLTETIDPGASPHLNLTTSHAYDAAGREIAVRDPAGTVRRTFFDAQGRVAKAVENCTNVGTTILGDPAWKACTGAGTNDATWNLTTTFGYDARGNKTSEFVRHIGTDGLTTTWTYNDLDQLTKQVDNDVATPTLPTEDVTTEYAYDANGRQVAVRSPSPAGGTTVTRTLYDSLGRVTSTIADCIDTSPPANWWECTGSAPKTTAVNVTATFTYDADGHRLSVTGPSPAATDGSDAPTVTTRNAYDAAGRLCRVLENATVDLDGSDRCTRPITGTATTNVSTLYSYDPRGNLATMIDGRGNPTLYGYDVRGRMIKLDQPGVATDLVWAYNDSARTKTQTNRSTGSVTWTSDAAGRVISRAYQDASGTARTTTYGYDSAGTLATASDAGSAITVTSDRLGRPVTVTVASDTAAATTYGYSFTAPTRTDASGTTTMALDMAGRITSITDPVHASPFTWTYGAAGQVTSAVMPTTPSLTTTSTYDALGRLLTKVTGTRAAYTESYNRAGNRLSETSTITGDPANGTAATTWDPLDRLAGYVLPGIRTLGATFDAVPDRTDLTTDGTPVSTVFDLANRPTSGGYGYDADGRMTTRAGTAGTTFAYDSLGRLASVRQDPGNTPVAAYAYDALDRLLTVTRPSQATLRFR
ncbi:MAG: DUF6531 domain-containing protein, partial [Chloroflexota bacterium]